MAQLNNRQQLIALFIFIIAIGLILLLLSLYFTNHDLFYSNGLNSDFLDDLFTRKYETWKFLGNNSFRIVLIIMLSTSLLTPSRINKDNNLKKHIILSSLGIIIFLLLPFIPRTPHIAQFFYVVINIALTIFILIHNFNIASILSPSPNKSLSENAKNADGFNQNQIYMENEYSFNIPYKYQQHGKQKNGWINVINPFRATLILGKPGSGKSFAVLKPALYQMIHKGFTIANYDYKDPTLSKAIYNYWISYVNTLPNDAIKPRFAYISFVNLRKTYRCNPLKGISTSAEAQDVASSILTSLNPDAETKKGEFFTESANSFLSILIYSLGLVQEGKYLSLPHVLGILSQKTFDLFSFLKLLSIYFMDIKALFTPFSDAYEDKVLAQLQGQLGSTRIGISKLTDATLAYVLTEDLHHPEFNTTLDVNNPKNPKILTIGNDPEKDKIIGLADSVLFTKLAKVINVPNQLPVAVVVDELPTMYFRGFTRLVTVGRSNYIATMAGAQDFSQFRLDYGDKQSDVTIDTISNIFCGAASGRTAEIISKSFGQKTVLKKSSSISASGDISNSFQESKEPKITIDTINELSQGDFVGIAVDNFDQKTVNKAFHGTLIVDNKYNHSPEEIPDLRDISDDDLEKEIQSNFLRVNNEISSVLASSNHALKTYERLKHITLKEGNSTNYSLEEYMDSKSITHLAIWCEIALEFDDCICKMQIKRLPDKKLRFELLIRHLWTQDDRALEILNAIEANNFFEMDNVRRINQNIS